MRMPIDLGLVLSFKIFSEIISMQHPSRQAIFRIPPPKRPPTAATAVAVSVMDQTAEAAGEAAPLEKENRRAEEPTKFHLPSLGNRSRNKSNFTNTWV